MAEIERPELKKLSVVMPVYNESRTLRTIIRRVLEAPIGLDVELVAVDDCSTDGSLAILEEMAMSDKRVKVVSHPVNMGKGRAIRTAIEHLTGDVAIIQDADLEYDPEDYALVLAPLLSGKADAVYGSRFAVSEQRRVLFFWHALGNRLLTLMANMANDLNLTDMETCYKAVRADILKRLRLTSDRFGFEPEITARLAQWGARIYEVPISYHGRTYAEGKNIGWRDGVEAMWLIVKYRFFDSSGTDQSAVVTRQSLSRAPRLRRWLLSRFASHLGARVLELDAGAGHTTRHLLEARQLVVADDDAVHVETLRRRYGHLENLTICQTRELTAQDLQVDTAILFEGLQRAETPKDLLASVARYVESGGHILIQVPAHRHLWGVTDEAIGHVRRFEASDVEEMVWAAGLELVSMEEINRLGAIAWRLHHVTGAGGISSAKARIFDLLVPVARLLEPLLPGRGLSVLAVARVP